MVSRYIPCTGAVAITAGWAVERITEEWFQLRLLDVPTSSLCAAFKLPA